MKMKKDKKISMVKSINNLKKTDIKIFKNTRNAKISEGVFRKLNAHSDDNFVKN